MTNFPRIQKVNLSKTEKNLILTLPSGERYLVNTNLIRYHLGVSYTNKQGVEISEKDIKAKKAYAHKKLMGTMEANNPQTA